VLLAQRNSTAAMERWSKQLRCCAVAERSTKEQIPLKVVAERWRNQRGISATRIQTVCNRGATIPSCSSIARKRACSIPSRRSHMSARFGWASSGCQAPKSTTTEIRTSFGHSVKPIIHSGFRLGNCLATTSNLLASQSYIIIRYGFWILRDGLSSIGW